MAIFDGKDGPRAFTVESGVVVVQFLCYDESTDVFPIQFVLRDSSVVFLWRFD